MDGDPRDSLPSHSTIFIINRPSLSCFPINRAQHLFYPDSCFSITFMSSIQIHIKKDERGREDKVDRPWGGEKGKYL